MELKPRHRLRGPWSTCRSTRRRRSPARPGARSVALAGLVLALPALGSLSAQAAPSKNEQGNATAGALSARVGAQCTDGRLRLFLTNRSDAEQTFTIKGPDDEAGTISRTVAAGEHRALSWTRPDGRPYAFEVTAPGGFKKTESGTGSCGLGEGKPQMNTTELFSSSTRFEGMLGPDGKEYTGTSKSVRIPAMAVTNNGTVLAVTDARIDGSADLPGNVQIGMRRSTDSGQTWSTPEIVQHSDTTKEGSGDSSLLVDRETNRVFLFYNHSPEGTGFFNRDSRVNTPDDPNSLHIRYRTSDDDGRTWSEPVELNPQVKSTTWMNLFAASGHGIQTDGGRLIQPIVYRTEDDVTHATNIISDDHGRTWRPGAKAGSLVNESKAVQRGNGDIAQNMRHNTMKNRNYATSPDGSAPYGEMKSSDVLVDPRNNGDEISYLKPGPGAPGLTRTALFSNTASATARENLTVRLSTDDGANWSHDAVIEPGEAGYSTMAVLGDGSVGNLYEVDGFGGIFFSRFTPDWIKQ
ncbi:exo-alpha-sialidase [Streptomyces sp. HNM0574]|uniref:exo-alpha-sialidase n=1 Tax=Streptomyces sp. HNM0574 TaxID=2714954 RepID=UPI00146D7C63|nr:exo-alpha-sialidase [Streptomyces sp. HNM0574]NLU70333.1 DUF756 domain-containing protein [Streptomyces sp. HNM0574]